ncbi:hypothetical protein PSCLAVI8L_350008 [Pseudoclavibacter sp. 8L]|nr:hypothetical protein PSCLAVI8L_350008 [Pseudoclavibacter sp. 8L]
MSHGEHRRMLPQRGGECLEVWMLFVRVNESLPNPLRKDSEGGHGGIDGSVLIPAGNQQSFSIPKALYFHAPLKKGQFRLRDLVETEWQETVIPDEHLRWPERSEIRRCARRVEHEPPTRTEPAASRQPCVRAHVSHTGPR